MAKKRSYRSRATAAVTSVLLVTVSPLAWAAAATDGAVDPSFAPPALDSLVLSMLPVSDGKTLIGGYFTDAGGDLNQDYLIRINPDGSLDTSFTPPAITSPASNRSVWALAGVAGGKTVVGGILLDAGGNADADYIVRIGADGTLDTSFIPSGTKPQLNNTPYVILPLGDGTILVGGGFTTAYGDGSKRFIVRMSADGSLYSPWTPPAGVSNVNGSNVWGLAELTNGKIIVGHDFNGNSFSIMDADGTNASSTNLGGSVKGFVPLADGSLIVYGDFTNAGGVPAIDRLARLNADGTLDTSWVPPVVPAEIYSASLTPDGQIMIGGTFASINGDSSFKYLARVNGDGTLDETFIPLALNSLVRSLSTTESGTGLVGGYFTSAGGVTGLDYLARFLSPPEESSDPQAPRAPLQQYGINPDGECTAPLPDATDFPALLSMKMEAWGKSWAWWPNSSTGGWVCTRQPYYTGSGSWAVR